MAKDTMPFEIKHHTYSKLSVNYFRVEPQYADDIGYLTTAKYYIYYITENTAKELRKPYI